jgi:hypothetical protein
MLFLISFGRSKRPIGCLRAVDVAIACNGDLDSTIFEAYVNVKVIRELVSTMNEGASLSTFSSSRVEDRVEDRPSTHLLQYLVMSSTLIRVLPGFGQNHQHFIFLALLKLNDHQQYHKKRKASHLSHPTARWLRYRSQSF